MADTFQFDPESEDYNLLMDILGELSGSEKTESNIGGWNESPKTLLEAATRIAFHETAGTLDPSSRQIYKGKPQGAASGLFHYELGEDQGAHSAINRVENYYKYYTDKERPDWIDSVNAENDYNLAVLSPEQQYITFFLDKAIKENSSMMDIDEPGFLEDFWVDYHAIPSIEDRVDRLNSFNESQGVYQDTLLDQILPKEFLKEEGIWKLKDASRKALFPLRAALKKQTKYEINK